MRKRKVVLGIPGISENQKVTGLFSGIDDASGNMVDFLFEIGALYADAHGIHASEQGRYRLKIPTQTANPSGDK